MKTHNLTINILASALALAAFCSCQDKMQGIGFTKGEAVKFSVGTDAAETKAAYSGVSNAGKERIDWQAGDLIRIYCGAVSEPATKNADYVVTEIVGSANEISKAKIGHTSPGELGLRWGTGSHTFYAVFPSPAAGESSEIITQSITGKDVNANLPAIQKVASLTGSGTTNCVAVPDLKNMLMTAKSKTYTESSGITDAVFLGFTPLTTAVQFTITNQTKSSLTIKSVSLTSATGALNGAFSVNLDNMIRPAAIDMDGDDDTTGEHDITYSRDYPACTYTGEINDATRTVTINFSTPVTLTYDADPEKSGKLTFTFFLQPCQKFDDLTFKLVKQGDGWMSMKLGYTDGSGIVFPRHKKTFVTGLLVPEGAQWTVKYSPDIEPWDVGSVDPKPVEVSFVSPIL